MRESCAKQVEWGFPFGRIIVPTPGAGSSLRTLGEAPRKGPVGEWLSSGLQIRLRRFESGPGLQFFKESDVLIFGIQPPGTAIPTTVLMSDREFHRVPEARVGIFYTLG